MRGSIVVAVGAILCGLVATPAAGATSVSDLGWLAGCWSLEGGERGSEEHWLAPAGGTLLGVSRTVERGVTVAWEFMQIRESAPGELVFIARPSGQAEAAFPLLRLAANEVVFADPAHDFPQRILYRRDGPRLRARVEGEQDGRPAAIDFVMLRRACD